MAKNSYIGILEEAEKLSTQILLLSWTCSGHVCLNIIPDSWCFSLVNPGKNMQFDSLFLDVSVVILSRDPRAVVEQLHPALFVARY